MPSWRLRQGAGRNDAQGLGERRYDAYVLAQGQIARGVSGEDRYAGGRSIADFHRR